MAQGRRMGGLAIGAIVAVSTLVGCDPAPRPMVVSSNGSAGDSAPGDGTCATSDGTCTFRAAIEEANAAPGKDVVRIGAGVEPTLGGVAVPIAASLDLEGGGSVLRDRLVHTGGALVVRDLTVTGVATPSGCGGAVTSTGTALTLERVTVRGNSTAGNHGGGVCTNNPLTLIDAHVTDNVVLGAAGGTGGGVRTSGSLTLVGSTVDGNRTPQGIGSQVSVSGTGSLTVLGSTVDGGPAATSAFLAPAAQGQIVASTLGAGLVTSPAVVARGTVLTRCTGGSAPTLGGYDLVGDGCGTPGPTDRPGPPRLDPLWPVGRTAPTRAPSVDSDLLDAIPAGTPELCVAGMLDQRGRPRLVGPGCDIGAVERQTRITADPGGPLDRPSALGGTVHAVDPSGVAVGATPSFDWLPQHPPNAIRWSPDGTRTVLSTSAVAYDVDPAGTIVGARLTGPSTSVAVRWSPAGVAQDIAPLQGDTAATALGIDLAGRVYGTSRGTGGTRAWWRPADLGAATVLDSLGRHSAFVVDDDDHGQVLGRLTDAGGANPEWVVWDVDAGTATRLPTSSIPGAGARFSAIDQGAVYGSTSRPDLGNGCPDDPYGNVCTTSHAFTMDLATGQVTRLPAPEGPFAGVSDVDGRGRALVEALSYANGCAGCPTFVSDVQVVDVATLEVTPIDLPLNDGGSAIGDGGHVIGSGVVGSVGDFYPAPFLARTSG